MDMPNKVLTIFGTRPEAIKLAPVIKALEAEPSVTSVVCITAQHRQMLDQVLRTFSIVPKHDLNIMAAGQDLFDITVRSLEGLKAVMEQERPDLVLVQGDTTTAFTAGLAAYYSRVPLGHVEAGLRTYLKYSPFPEEINRRLVSAMADLHFAPTEWAKSNLLAERIPADRISVTGNTVVDALLWTVKQQTPAERAALQRLFRDTWGIAVPPAPGRRLILVTGHRRENFGKPFEEICRALRKLAERKDVEIVYPVHLNPNVQGPVRAILSGLPNIRLIEPLDYSPFVFLMNSAYLILTDSGGIQEEAPSLGKPVLVMRDTTERPEGIQAGTVKLVGTNEATIVREAGELLDDPGTYEAMSRAANPYGDGRAAERIASVILKNLGNPSPLRSPVTDL
ncbi:MAG: UDP-N-acetylglucosamine 2-epimerase (non-hydrolyzing) [Nitrospirota bacterium]